VLGRPKVKPALERRIPELRAEGIGMVAIGRRLTCGTSAVQRVLRKNDDKA
jgi:hypothetical protein